MFLSWVPPILGDSDTPIYPDALHPLRDLYWPFLQKTHCACYNYYFGAQPQGYTPVIYTTPSSVATSDYIPPPDAIITDILHAANGNVTDDFLTQLLSCDHI